MTRDEALAVCRSSKYETGEGTCALICMSEMGDVRSKGCHYAEKVHGQRKAHRNSPKNAP